MTKPEMILFADSARGQYIPQYFATEVKRELVTGLEPDDWTILETGPDHELYWDVWIGVCDSAVVTNPDNGIKYTLHQDGDLWLVPEGMEWSEAEDGFIWPALRLVK
jgi:hypothetical protein